MITPHRDEHLLSPILENGMLVQRPPYCPGRFLIIYAGFSSVLQQRVPLTCHPHPSERGEAWEGGGEHESHSPRTHRALRGEGGRLVLIGPKWWRQSDMRTMSKDAVRGMGMLDG